MVKARPLLTIAALLLCPAVARAQLDVSKAQPAGVIPLYHHPEVKQYNSPADWPLLDAQGHWCPGGSTHDGEPVPCFTATDDPLARDGHRMSHIHMGCQAPIYGIITATLVLPCRVMIFQAAGRLDRVDIGWASALNGTAVWDNTHTNNPGPVVGDPGGLVMHTFTMTVPPDYWTRHARGPNGHGANSLHVTAFFRFDNGDSMETKLELPFFIATDPTQPVRFAEERTNPKYRLTPLVADAQPTSARDHKLTHELAIGGVSIRVNDWLPLPTGPLAARRAINLEIGRYSDPNMAKGITGFFAELRDGVNLHRYSDGTVLDRTVNTQDRLDKLRVVNISRVFTLDPAGMPAGRRVGMIRWSTQCQTANETCVGGEEMQTLLTFPYAVGANSNPPPPRGGGR